MAELREYAFGADKNLGKTLFTLFNKLPKSNT